MFNFTLYFLQFPPFFNDVGWALFLLSKGRIFLAAFRSSQLVAYVP